MTDDGQLSNEPGRLAPWRGWALSILMAVLLAVTVRAEVAQSYTIPSESMSSTLLVGDQIIVNKLYPLFGTPARGDIIVFDSPLEAGSNLVKRVVGLPGEQVELRGHVLYINGDAVVEPYAKYMVTDHWSPITNHFGPIAIPAGTVLVLGDNRDNSTDSRYFGPVPLETVKGKAVLRHWSWSGDGFGVRWDRVGESL